MDKGNFIISIRGEQTTDPDERPDLLELVTDGVYAAGDDGATFSYDESELTGLEGTRTTFLVEPDRVTMTRQGTVNTQMVFQEGRKHYFAYDTPFGSMLMGLNTGRLRTHMGEAGGEVEIRYAIDMESSIVSRNVFHINIRKA